MVINPNFSTEVYWKSFREEMRAAWTGTIFAKSHEELASLCYYRMLTAFFQCRPEDLQDRRTALYHFASSYFDVEDKNSPLLRYRNILPADSPIPRIIRLLSLAYDQEPSRSWGDERTTELLLNAYKEGNTAVALRELYKVALLCGVAAIKPFYFRGKLRYFVLPPDMFRVVTYENDPTEVEKIVYPSERDMGDGRRQRVFNWYDEEFYWATDSDGKKIVPETPHGYGRIPFAIMRLGSGVDFWTGGMYAEVEQTLRVNLHELLSVENAVFNGFSILVATNMVSANSVGQTKIRLSAGDVVQVDARDTESAAPSLDYVTPSPQYHELRDEAAAMERAIYRRAGIPPSMTGETQQILTGVSRIIERQELIENRDAHLEILYRFEQDFFQCLASVANTDGGRSLPNDLEVDVTFADPTLYMEVKDEYEFDKMKVRDGVMEVLAFSEKWGGNYNPDAEQQTEPQDAENV
jgi:hypothetical protein